MYKKLLALVITVGCITVANAETPNNNAYVKFSNGKLVSLDQLASAQERVNYLQSQHKRTKSEMGGGFAAMSMLLGFTAVGLATFIKDEETRENLQKGLGVFAGIGTVGGLAVMAYGDNSEPEENKANRQEAEKLQAFILNNAPTTK